MKIKYLFLAFFIILILFFRGTGKPDDKNTQIASPLELSISSSRYALTKAVAQRGSIFLDKEEAKLASPDFSDSGKHFISIFTPGVSFIGVPFYMLGKILGIPLQMTFFAVMFFAMLNFYLIFRIVKTLGAGEYPALISGAVFLFATDALGYALTFTQHHITVTILLSIIYLTVKKEKTWLSYLTAGALYGISILIDLPNIFILLPAVLIIFSDLMKYKKYSVPVIFTAGLIPFVILFAAYNSAATGSVFKTGQMLGRSEFYRNRGSLQNRADYHPPGESESVSPGKIALLVNGLYVLLISPERSWIFYSPVILFGVWGLWLYGRSRKNPQLFYLSFITVVLNIILYSLFDDPWGGWAFGPRYLIPSAAVLSIFTGYLLQYIIKNKLLTGIFKIILFYSIGISVIGAVTTNAVPPAPVAKFLGRGYGYTFLNNFNMASDGISANLIYNVFFKNHLNLIIYSFILSAVIYILITVPLNYYRLHKHEK